MRSRGWTDDDLMRRLAGGDKIAGAELVRRHRGWVCNLLHAFTRDRDQAEDLTQEVFCRAVRHAGDYAAQGRFRAWLTQIAANLGRSYLSRARLTLAVPLDALGDTAPPADARTDPLALVLDEVVHAQVRQAILSLPDEQRRVIALRYFSGMTVLEVARAVGCPEGTVKSRLFHGLRRLRERLTSDGTETQV